MSNCIVIHSLNKNFGTKPIFINAKLEIEENSITALSGENASGKTTLLKLISGLLLPDSGKIFIYNNDITKNRSFAKSLVSIALNTDFGFYPYFTLKENLLFLCKLYRNKIQNLYSFINELKIDKFVDTKFIHTSSGIKTLFWLLASLVKKPKILLVDELSKSLDKDTKQIIYNLIKTFKIELGITTIFVSHDEAEINLLADRWIKIENFNFSVIK